MSHLDHVMYEHHYYGYNVTYADLLKIKEEVENRQPQPVQEPKDIGVDQDERVFARIEAMKNKPVQEPLAWQSIESMAAERYKVVLSHQSMFYRYAVVAGNGAQQLYIGRETECANMARKFAGAFLDGAHVVRYLNNTSPQAQPLTHLQAKALVEKYGNDPLHLIFQTEAAHGITKGTT